MLVRSLLNNNGCLKSAQHSKGERETPENGIVVGFLKGCCDVHAFVSAVADHKMNKHSWPVRTVIDEEGESVAAAFSLYLVKDPPFIPDLFTQQVDSAAWWRAGERAPAFPHV